MAFLLVENDQPDASVFVSLQRPLAQKHFRGILLGSYYYHF